MACVFFLCAAQAALAQSLGTASLSGHILSEEGRALRARVTLSFAAPHGFPAPPRRVLTSANGAFSFSRLPAGKYTLCAQIADPDTPPADSPLVDTCVWGSPLAPITLTAGQQAAGIVFTDPKGAWLKIRVVDPDHVLPQSLPPKGPAILDPQLQPILKGKDNLVRHLRFIGSDPSGRNYQAVVPLNAPLTLSVTSSTANIFDQNGKQLTAKDAIPIQAASPAALAPLTITLRRGSH